MALAGRSVLIATFLVGIFPTRASAVTRIELPKQIPEGFDVNLTCIFPNISDIGSSIHWTIPGIPQGRTLQEDSGRYIVSSFIPTISGGRGWSKLTVTGTDDTDAGRYRCQILDGENTLVETSETELSVLEFETLTDSVCWVEPTSTAVADTETEFKCATRLKGGTRPYWKVGSADLEGEITETQNLTFVNQTLEVPVQLNRAAFSCVSGSTTLCTARVTLLYPPIVNVSAFGDIVYGSDARYFCDATAEPSDGLTYRWYYADYPIIQSTHHRFNRVLLENDNKTLVLPDLSARFDEDIPLTCEVTNAVGTGRSTPYIIKGNAPRSIANVIGPIFLSIIILLIILVLVIFYLWRRSQRRVVRRISSKRKTARGVRRTPSELPVSTNPYVGSTSFVPVSPMDLEAIGYGPDVTSKTNQMATPSFDRDSGVGDDGIRPIPSRRGSMSSSVGRVNRGYDGDERDGAGSEASSDTKEADAYEMKMKSYSYEVNPNYNNYRKSQTLDLVSIPTPDNASESDTEIKTIPSDSDDEDHLESSTSGIIASTDL